MSLTRGNFQSYDFDRMVVLFTMMSNETEIPCAVTTDAMDYLENLGGRKPGQREEQFLRLRDGIEERVARKFLNLEFEGSPPRIVLRRIDLRN
jgi:Protein of unknown function (DUF1488)